MGFTFKEEHLIGLWVFVGGINIFWKFRPEALDEVLLRIWLQWITTPEKPAGSHANGVSLVFMSWGGVCKNAIAYKDLF